MLGNHWKAPTNDINRKIDYQTGMVEPEKYIKSYKRRLKMPVWLQNPVKHMSHV